MKSTHIIMGLCMALSTIICSAERLADHIDPRIGSEGLGRVFIGPATPFGMVRPGPDCTPSPNSGWLPMPERVDGFAQTHVSGTGGGPKYGNILIQPFMGDFSRTSRPAFRENETIECGYYATTYAGSGIKVEVTTAPRASFYRIAYPKDQTSESARPSLLFDAGFFLGESPVPDAREAQQFVGSEISVIGDNAVCGYSRIRGGWNNGRAYTVYFYAETSPAFAESATWRGSEIGPEKARTDHGDKTGALVAFRQGADTVDVRVGISFISIAKARENLHNEISQKSFDEVRADLLADWEKHLGRITIAEDTPDSLKRMFYTGLYHTMLMPSDRTGENPLWTDSGVPYYDDFYAIWDTYRTSMPLITLIDPARQAAIVSSLVNIGRRDGYMPDARSGNANGRTQGGSNADIAVADAFVKGVGGIDYEAALAEMIKDAEIDPGHDHEAHGRGGLNEYKSLGYIPFGIDRAGNRTVEYSFCDFAIAQVAKGLGKHDLASKYESRSHNWQNLWRPDFADDGATGFIMPRAANGQWLDSLTYGHSSVVNPRYSYHPMMFEGPWYTPWWSMFFYEAPSWEYSLSMPHDVERLIEACGGAEAFSLRLNNFFDHGHYNVNNEPSFLSPCLYHWIGRPDLSSERVREIVAANFNDGPSGLPGNDDSGAMSSWLAFHILGLYPNAAHPYYLVNSPMVAESTIDCPSGQPFRIVAEGLDDSRRFIASASLNGRDYPWSTIPHDSIMAGGELRLVMSDTPSGWGRQMMPTRENPVVDAVAASSPIKPSARPWTTREYTSADTVAVTYYLHGQKRRFTMEYRHLADGGIDLVWGIERNLKWWEGCYSMTAGAVAAGTDLSLVMPEDGNWVDLPGNETFGIISRKSLRSLVDKGYFILNGVVFNATATEGNLIKAEDRLEGASVLILNDERLPLIWKMDNNPLEINWEVTKAVVQ